MAHKRWMHCTQVGLRSGRQMIYLINFFSQKVVTINKERDKETEGLVFKNEKQSYARVRLRLSVYLIPRFSKVPRNATELKRCMVIERRCSKKGVSLLSPVDVVSLRPRCDKKFRPVSFIGIKISRARGTKKCVFN